MGRKPGRVFSFKPKVPCPRCYAPLTEAGAVCMSKGCIIDRKRRGEK